MCELARATAAHLAPGGVLVLAGLLDRQALRVTEAHRRHRLALQARIDVSIWTTLVLRARPYPSAPKGAAQGLRSRPRGPAQGRKLRPKVRL